jgi:hypothetical protein
MEFLAELALILMTLGIGLFVLLRYAAGRDDLVSVRNVALGGFVVFQTMSAALWLLNDHYLVKFQLLEPGGTAMKFVAGCVLFLAVAFLVYGRGWIAVPLARLVPAPRIVPSDAAMWMTVLVLTGSAAVFRFAVLIPYVNILAEIMGTAVAGAASGFAGWLIVRNLKNPVVWAMAAAAITTNLGIALTGEYGRRTIITIALGVAFGVYYGKFRYERPARTLTFVAMAMIPMILFVGAYTSVRGGDNRRGSFLTQVKEIARGGNVAAGLQDFDGQGVGGISLWLIEHFGPDGARRPDHFRTFIYFAVYPLPRAFFPWKPEPLSLDIPRYANLVGVKQGGLTLGPGIIGHSFADGGWHVVILYAAFGAIIIRFCDEVIRRTPYAPFVVLPMGSILGEIMGVPRGETSAMLFKFVFGTASAYVYIAGIGHVLQAMGYAQAGDPNAEGFEDGAGDPGEDDGYADDEFPGDGYSAAAMPGNDSSTSTAS